MPRDFVHSATGRQCAIPLPCRLLLLFAATFDWACVGASRAPTMAAVAAVVDGKAITRAELVDRTRVYEHMFGNDSEHELGSLNTVLMPLVLDRMIDEVLEARVASRKLIAVSQRAIDEGTRDYMLRNGARTRVAYTEYRDELARRMLEKKLVEAIVWPRVRVTETDARAVYSVWSQDFAQRYVEVRALRVPIRAGAVLREIDAQVEAVDRLVGQVPEGEDLCRVVAWRSLGHEARCGSTAVIAIEELPPGVAEVARRTSTTTMDRAISMIDDDGTRVVVAFQFVRSPRCPDFDAVQDKMYGLAFSLAVSAAVDEWLRDMRREAQIEILWPRRQPP